MWLLRVLSAHIGNEKNDIVTVVTRNPIMCRENLYGQKKCHKICNEVCDEASWVKWVKTDGEKKYTELFPKKPGPPPGSDLWNEVLSCEVFEPKKKTSIRLGLVFELPQKKLLN